MDNGISKIPGNPDGGVMTELYSGTLMSEDSTDYIVPEYIPDTGKILLCTASPKIDGKFTDGGSVAIEGTVYFSLLLAGEDGTVSGLSFSEPFSAKAAVDGLDDDCTVSLVPSVGYVTARLVNPRKIGVRCQINTDIRVFCCSPVGLTVKGAENVADEAGIRKKTVTAGTADITAFEERGIAVSQDIELDGSFPQIGEMILCRVRLNPAEVRVGDSGADTRTDALVSCIYRSDSGNCVSADRKFTLEHHMDIPTDGGREWTAYVFPSPAAAKVTPNSYGEMKVIELDFTYDLGITGMKNREVALVSDVYSTDYETAVETGEKNITVFGRCFACGLSLNASAAKSEINAEDAVSVFTGSVNTKDVTAHYDPGKRKLITEGDAEITAVYTAGEDGGNFGRAVFTSHFRCETDAPDSLPADGFIISCSAGDTRFRSDPQNIYCDTELSLRVTALGSRTVGYTASVTLDRDSPAVHADSPMTLYYPVSGESLFDIAKHYRVTDESIMTANRMTDCTADGRKVLIIPAFEGAS